MIFAKQATKMNVWNANLRRGVAFLARVVFREADRRLQCLKIQHVSAASPCRMRANAARIALMDTFNNVSG